MSRHGAHADDDQVADEETMLDPTEVDEEIADDGDAPMDSDDDENNIVGEIALQNDSVAHFDTHTDSIFCIAQHPVHPQIIATGGGDDVGYVFDATPLPTPPNGNTNSEPKAREGLTPLHKLTGHKDSLNSIAFTYPAGQYLCTAGLDGQLRVWSSIPSGTQYRFLAAAQEVEEINWLAPCPHPSRPNILALGANDGSVWIYQIDRNAKGNELHVLQAFYLHTASCTAGSWTPDGELLATVAEDSSLYVWDVFGAAEAAGLAPVANSQHVVGLTGADERFRVEGGLYSVAVASNAAFVAVGGPEGQIRVVGLPRVAHASSASAGSSGSGARSKVGGGKQVGGPKGAAASAGQAGQILASLQAGTDNVESISFSQPPLTLMAVGNVDSSITLFDTAHRFAVRRRIEGAHADEEFEHSVVKVEFVKREGAGGWLLTSVGYDGVVRRWDARGGTTAAGKGLVGEWKGHRGGGEGGGVMGFVQGGGEAVVTAGDDSIALVFQTPVQG
ncbi:WD40 repeat-like protein [Polyplosphaeria fusca]|uniref:WD40 repeat-like protein n=1 Tax=Polyplosphaeria fusca TaxID=682080 RepID=A0A9P4UXF0_9PLEO|nr:WD40 repeat-like protein [Polyplosphaeria fusca]